MKLEIKTKCAVCGIKVEHYVGPGDACYRYLCIQPCPNCHPAKVEKVTPGAGKTVEVRGNDYPEGSHSTRTATGRRHDGFVETNSLNASTAWWDQWRYPDETDDEWKE